MTTIGQTKLTPAMQQYDVFKKQHPNCVLFFRMGDFYEMFYEDAHLAHRVLGVTLTQRTTGIPMAGVPYHAVEGYLNRMIQAGYCVAVCDQVEEAAQAKGIVKRKVTRVITPGTLTDESLLAEDRGNALAAVSFDPQGNAALAWAELSTGSLTLATVPLSMLPDELARIGPRELLFCQTPTGEAPPPVQAMTRALGCAATGRPSWQFRRNEAAEAIKRQYQVVQLAGFGIQEDDPAIGPAGAVLHYLRETQKTDDQQRLGHLQPPRRYERTEHMVIDQTSLRSLEVEATLHSGSTQGSLVGVLQGCVTAMGKRELRHWLCYPLRDRAHIEQRQRVVEALVSDSRFLDRLQTVLDTVHDVPRITARLAVGRASPRDLVALGRSAECTRGIEQLLADRPAVATYHEQANVLVEPLEAIAIQIQQACVEAPPAHLREGGLIQDGFDSTLDEYRRLSQDSHTWLAGYQKQLIDQTQISSLKVGYNKVFGYYIEVTAANKEKAATDWTCKQTLKNAERFITPELKDFETKVLSAESRAIAREADLFEQLCDEARRCTQALQSFAQIIAELDVLGCFAQRAVRYRYVKPRLVEAPLLHIEGGRHPVLDELLGDRFVPNDVRLGAECQSTMDPTLALITGPNMSGKSTYIRQTALIVLLAHTGSFVPADTAMIGMCDRIFTRVGANDQLHAGQSTFMVEMTETARICNHCTPASLIILDEVGRGTSTLDGLSLAWAIAEHLVEKRPRCLFATHYHELTQLSDQYANVTNLNVMVREWQDQVVFLHRITPGATNRSYGIHVAKIAGLPDSVLIRARDLLGQLSVRHETSGPVGTMGDHPQLPLFAEPSPHPVVDRLGQINLEQISPIQAFDALRQLKDLVEDPEQPDPDPPLKI